MPRERTICLKGVAIFIIIVAHVGGYYTRIFTPLGAIGVAVFLMLSGYGLSCSYENKGLKGYWRKRIVSVFLPYALFELVTIPIRDSVTPKKYILDVLMVRVQHPLGWYLSYLLLWYITFWIIKKLKIKNENIVLLLTSIFYACFYFYRSPLKFEQSFSFLIGMNMATVFDRLTCLTDKKKKYVIRILLSVSIIILAVKQISFIRENIGEYIEFMNMGIAVIAALAIICYMYCFETRLNFAFYYVGVISFELYLVHGRALALWNKDYSTPFVIVLFIIISLAGSLMCWYVNGIITGFFNKMGRTTFPSNHNMRNT